MKFIILILIIVFFMNSKTNGQFNPIEFEKDILDNGLTVIYHSDKSIPVVSVITHYKVGSTYELKNQKGYAHFFEHLMFSETENIENDEMEKMIISVGGSINAHTAKEETVYKIKVPSHQLPLALWIESERMRKLKFNQKNIDAEKKVVLEEKSQSKDDIPYGDIMSDISKIIFKDTPYEWEVIGEEEDIKNAKIEDFKKFYDSYYQPSNAIISISGDFEIDTARKIIKKYFSEYPEKEIPDIEKYHKINIKKDYFIEKYDKFSNLPAIFMVWKGASNNDRDFALDVLMTILSGGESSRLHKKIVEENQSGLFSFIFSLKFNHAGMILFQSIVHSKENLNSVKENFDNIINDIIENGVTEKELKKAKNSIESQFILSKYQTIANASVLASYEAIFQDPGLINTDLQNYLKLDIKDIQKAAKKYFLNQNRILIFSYPVSENED